MLHSYRVLNRKPTNQYIKAKENKWCNIFWLQSYIINIV
jgi:hypothetical protein